MPLDERALAAARKAVGTIPGAALWGWAETAVQAYLDALATPPSSPVMGVGEGFVVVPVEPTDAMIEAGKDSLFEHARFVAIDRDPLFCWRAMVHAAASPAQAKEGKDG